jgi:hypothetical protein
MKSLGLKLRSEPLRRHLIVSSGRFYQRANFQRDGGQRKPARFSLIAIG